MPHRPQHFDDRSRIRTLRTSYTAVWIFVGMPPPIIAAWDRSPATRYWTVGVLAALALGCVVVRAAPRGSVFPPYSFLGSLILGVGAMSFLLGGGAAFFIVSLPQFWIFARSPRHAIVLSGAAAVTTVVGGTVRYGWNAEYLTGNAVFTLFGYAAGVLLGLWMHRMVWLRDERNRRLNEELRGTQAKLVEAYQRQGAADERERLAREIHDTLARGFASIVVLAEAARAGMESDPVRSARQVLSIERTARDNLAEARVLVGAGTMTTGSLTRTVGRVLDRFAEDTGLTVSTDLADVECDQPTRVALLRCAQESLANVRKHAGAATVGAVLAQHRDDIELEITDDGCGFVVGESPGFGLDGMRRRVAELGGELTLTSSVGDGTRVHVVVPAQPPRAT